MIKFINISKQYNDTLALKNINLTIKQGEIFGIIGASGAGKSTLVRCINAIEGFDAGHLIVDKKDLSQISKVELSALRKEVGFVFQNFNLMSSLTVFENIALPLKVEKLSKDEVKKKVDKLLEIVGLTDKANTYIKDLSGGQKQRIGIARAIALNPKVLLCDEATSALDPKTTDQILDLILTINQKLKITIVIITHEMEVIRKTCDQVAVMDKGEIIEQGRVIDIFAKAVEQKTTDLINNSFSTFAKKNWHFTKNSYILEFKYISDAQRSHVISELSRELKVDFNIIGGQIIGTRQGKFGQLVVEFFGKKDDVINWLDKKSIIYEVIENE